MMPAVARSSAPLRLMNGSGRPLEHVRRNDASGRPLICSLVRLMNDSGRPLQHVRIELATSEREWEGRERKFGFISKPTESSKA